MKRAHKLIVINEAVIVHVKDTCHCIHLQRVCGEFYKRQQVYYVQKGQYFMMRFIYGCLNITCACRFNLTGGKDVVYKLLVGDPTILVTVDASEHI